MRVQVGDVRLFFDVEGAKLRPRGPWLDERPTVLIVHTGPGVDHEPYKNHIGPALAEVAQVVYVDLRGHGRSDRGSPAKWNVETWSSDLKALTERLEIERPILLGAGWGAFTVLRYAARWPETLTSLVLSNPNARFMAQRSVAAYDALAGPEAGEIAFRFFSEPSEQTLGEFLRVCFPFIMGAPAAMEALVQPQWNLDLSLEWARTEMRTLDLRDDLAAIDTPTLVVAGDCDPQYPRVSIEEVVDGLPRVRAHWYEGARHSVWRDAPECISVVYEFVASEI
jgi:proline iminopeptidase